MVLPGQCQHFFAFRSQETQPAKHPELDEYGLLMVDVFYCQKCLVYQRKPVGVQQLSPEQQEEIRTQLAAGQGQVSESPVDVPVDRSGSTEDAEDEPLPEPTLITAHR